MTIEYLPLQQVTAMHADEIAREVERVVRGGWYLRGEATERFEAEYARYIGTRHCIGVANGLDALTLILRAYMEMGMLHEGDEVIVPANTFIASVLAITENRLTPVFVEPKIDTFLLDDALVEQAVTPRTRAVMLVHLYGRCAFTPRIGELCRRHSLLLIEDNAQAHGCAFHAPGPSGERGGRLRRTGSLGHAAGHSFYPGKNLGALGDAGAVTTDDDRLAAVLRSLANYGSSEKYVFDYAGRNSRIDEVQAAVLSVKLRHLDADNARRRQIAARYAAQVRNPLLMLPQPSESVCHILPLLSPQRDRLQRYLADGGVGTAIHYPIPPHKQACFRQWNHLSMPITERIHREELSLPCHQAMTDGQVARVIDLLNRFS